MRGVRTSIASRKAFVRAFGSSAAPEPVPQPLFGGSKMPRVPLTEGFPMELNFAEPKKSAEHKVTSTVSGIRCVSVGSTSPMATLGVYIDAGSRYEDRHSSGLTHFMERMALKSTDNRSSFGLVRTMSSIGASLSCFTSREGISFTSDCLPEASEYVMGAMADLIQNPRFSHLEVEEEKVLYAAEAEEREKDTQSQVLAAIHEAAYRNNSLGLPVMNPSNIENFTPQALHQYKETFFTPKRMVVAGVGMEHDVLQGMVEEMFTTLPDDTFDNAKHKTPATYTGGDVRLHNRNDQGMVTFALAFEGAGWSSDEIIPLCVLNLMMGGGSAFSAGGPGKGMFSRLFTNVLNRHHFIESARTMPSFFSDSGLFTLVGQSDPEYAENMVAVLVREAIQMAGPVDEEELQRAKTQLKTAVFSNTESRMVQIDMGTEVMNTGKIQEPSEAAALIDAVTGKDIQAVAERMFKSPISISAGGNLSHVPRYDVIQRMFQ